MSSSRLEPVTSLMDKGWYLFLMWHQEEFLALPTEQRHWLAPPGVLVFQSCACNTVAYTMEAAEDVYIRHRVVPEFMTAEGYSPK